MEIYNQNAICVYIKLTAFLENSKNKKITETIHKKSQNSFTGRSNSKRT